MPSLNVHYMSNCLHLNLTKKYIDNLQTTFHQTRLNQDQFYIRNFSSGHFPAAVNHKSDLAPTPPRLNRGRTIHDSEVSVLPSLLLHFTSHFPLSCNNSIYSRPWKLNQQ